MDTKLKGKNALITGSSRGIGKSIALALAKEGCNIVINDITPAMEEAEKTVDEIKALGVNAEAFAADVSDYESVEKMVTEIQKKFQKIDILVNNAGITKDRTLKKMAKEEWYDVININLNSIYNMTHLVLPLMPDGGRIISLSSIAGLGGNFGQTNYSATKAGIVGFTKSLSKELGKNKITVNAIAPGFIKSKMTEKIPVMVLEQLMELIPMKEMGLPEDVADLAVFLASEQSKYITGQVIRIDGGLGM
ncbi:3-oxoacyl-[acyl-carrier-protein] reductase [Candidatus Woesearchaeota archaeon]|nr:3-oxoacyl-[acyl-carrier-protein] reductase [Candidatus Woesearchaeota archaeon]